MQTGLPGEIGKMNVSAEDLKQVLLGWDPPPLLPNRTASGTMTVIDRLVNILSSA
jgi:hypothetical protein